MSSVVAKNFNLPWHQHDRYWISVYAKGDAFSGEVLAALEKAGLQRLDDQGMALHTPRQWKPQWDALYAALEKHHALDEVQVALTPGETLPVSPPELKSTAAVQELAQSLWLGEALLENRILCYLQTVVSSRDKIFGYESFARVKADGGSVIPGDKIIAASKVLGIEYVIDRHLHVQAIKTFVSSEFDGFLFVNFFPGFIHRPAVYLEGLSETAKSAGMIAKHIVLDFTNAEAQHDIRHLKSVCDYARSRGYSIALDDIGSIEGAKRLVAEIRPDFVKIDRQLVRHIAEPGRREITRAIVEMTHAAGGTVIGESVETEETHQLLKSLGVDLFQGYLFSPPMPVEAALKKNSA